MKQFLSIVFFTIITFTVGAQNKNVKNHSLQQLNCKTCHECEVPTKKDPCLVPCPRSEMITVRQSPEEGPEIVILNELSKKYLPVNFSHKVHAQMSDMSGGCAGCHHYNTSGPILACVNCHEEKRQREDISKPDLEAAYHRQCITCHREWSHSTDCTSCHEIMNGKTASTATVLRGKDHPKVTQPEKIVYETNYQKGKLVTFFHSDHTNIFGAECISCHQKESCTRCHDAGKIKNGDVKPINNIIKVSKSSSDHHQPCFKCHATDDCVTCHKSEPAEGFNHASSTGWALNKFHEKLSCQKCHGTSGKFARLNSSCISCHKNFKTGSFNHAITGLQLDEIHLSAECTDCHAEANFSKTPICQNCHDDKSYPKNKPGTLVRTVRK